MRETLTIQTPDVAAQPSTLDAEIEKAKGSLRGRITRKLGRAITGGDHPLEIVSGKEADLRAIKEAGSTDASLTEVRSQLEKARTSVRGRVTRRLGRLITGKEHPLQIVSGKEARLSQIEEELVAQRHQDRKSDW